MLNGLGEGRGGEERGRKKNSFVLFLTLNLNPKSEHL